MTPESLLPEFEISAVRGTDLAGDELRELHDLFDLAYAEANHGYLDHSLERLGFVGRAHLRGSLVGLALGDVVDAELPRMDGPQRVVLGGIGCIDPAHRRGGLFSRICSVAVAANGKLAAATGRILACGRMGHPAGFRSLNHIPTVVPSETRPPSQWHLEVAAVVAELYGVQLERDSLIVQGSGSPIGFPRIDIDVDDAEWIPFREVDRSRGESLLALAWTPDAPDGW